MKGKRGVIFVAYLFILTLFMIGVVIVTYLKQQENANASLISPVDILELRDRLEIYEMIEEESISSALKLTNDSGAIFGTGDYLAKFREEFFKEMTLPEKKKYVEEFILENLTIDVVEIHAETIDFNSFISNKLYPESKTFYSGEKISFSRELVGKRDILKSKFETTVFFDFGFYFEFERTCEINNKLEVSC